MYFTVYIRVECFWKHLLTLSVLLLDPNSRTSEKIDCYSKNSNNVFFNLRHWGMCYFIFAKAKKEDKVQRIIFYYCLGQKLVCPFLKSKKFYFRILFFQLFFLMYRTGFCKFSKNILIFKVLVIFKNKKLNLLRCDPTKVVRSCLFFGI